MNWFYAENGQQKGPVSETDLNALAEMGALQAQTMLWREGMPGWQPLGQVRPDLALVSGAPMISGVAIPEQSKDLVIQQLREGVIIELVAPGASRYVGFWWRCLAKLIDVIIVWVAQQMVQFVMFMVLGVGMAGMGGAGPDMATAMGVLFAVGLVGGTLSLEGGYYTWMTSRFGGTLGKMALGLKVVTADGQPLTKKRSLARWASNGLLNWLIYMIVVAIPMVLVITLTVSRIEGLSGEAHARSVMISVFASIAAFFIGSLAGSFPWWISAFDAEKRALHDRICATRVVWK